MHRLMLVRSLGVPGGVDKLSRIEELLSGDDAALNASVFEVAPGRDERDCKPEETIANIHRGTIR